MSLDARLAAAWCAMSPAQRTAAVVRMEGVLRPIVSTWEDDASDDVPCAPVVVVRGGYRPRGVAMETETS